MQYIVAVLSAIVGLFIFSRLQKSKADSGQRDLEIKTAVIHSELDNLKTSVVESENQEKHDVAAIETKQKDILSGKDLVDFFVDRNKPQ